METETKTIIGYTKSGKPVYNVDVKHPVIGRQGLHSDFMEMYKDFTIQDHKDAIEIQMEMHKFYGNEWEKSFRSVTGDEWNDQNNPKGKQAYEGTREADSQQKKHCALAHWHTKIAYKENYK